MRIYIGTSGWSYRWNLKRRLDWYVEKSGLNAIELNSSFYNFPTPHVVASWAEAGKELSWCVKVHRSITHFSRLKRNAFRNFRKQIDLFAPLEKYVSYYLLQMPPTLKNDSESRDAIRNFVRGFPECKNKFAFEFRHATWFSRDTIEFMEHLGCVMVSVDAPESTGFPYEIYNVRRRVYLRMHGRTGWYWHNYTRKELKSTAKKIIEAGGQECHIFFNNDINMLENAREMKRILFNTQVTGGTKMKLLTK